MLLTRQILKTTDLYIKKLEAAGIITVSDLLHHYPRDIQNKTEYIDQFQLMDIREKNVVVCQIETIVSSKTKNNLILTKVILKDKNQYLVEAVWFGNAYHLKQLKQSDMVLIYGKPKYSYGKIEFSSPDIELFLPQNIKIQPIYPELQGIPSGWIEKKIELLREYIGSVDEIIPREFRQQKKIVSHAQLLLQIHFPTSLEVFESAKEWLAYEEIFRLQYEGIRKKQQFLQKTAHKTIQISLHAELMKGYIEKLPYTLTNAQKIALFQIVKDFEKVGAMNRLLQGDVGSGKTIVALLAALYIIQTSKTQVALMVPTEILATQHFSQAQEWFASCGFMVDILVGSLTEEQKRWAKEHLKAGRTHLIIGTHALIQEDVFFDNLGFVIIDEQHRFWVEQRRFLESGAFLNGRQEIYPHVLYMTATPIPRTLALTAYGDQDISIINEYPAGRQKIITRVIKEGKRSEINSLIEYEIEQGRQVYWISPLVEESEKIDTANATQTYFMLQELFPRFTIGLLHGRMRPKEKDTIMQQFFENKIQILSSTSVVEVGINNPNATIMCIEASERFWLSQLHQFRGRVGRGKDQSYCFLFTTKNYIGDRLKAMEETNDGFVLSEMDLAIRWPWEFFGSRQSGSFDIKFANLYDTEVIAQVREDIEIFFKKIGE